LELSARVEHPDPPADLNSRELPISEFRQREWTRIHQVGFGPIRFGKSALNRFDDPQRRFGVMYVAETFNGAFVEVLGVDAATVPGSSLSEQELRTHAWSLVPMASPWRLVDLSGPGPIAIGAHGGISTCDHGIAQRWSRQLYVHPDKPDGIYYRCRGDLSESAVALFDRARDKLGSPRAMGSLAAAPNRVILGTALERYRIAIV